MAGTPQPKKIKFKEAQLLSLIGLKNQAPKTQKYLKIPALPSNNSILQIRPSH
jgi:hypothetical protein